MEAVIDTPLLPMSEADNTACAMIRRRAEELEWESHNLVEATREYARAAAKGSVQAFKEIVRIAEDDGSPIQDEIVRALEEHWNKEHIANADVEFVKSKTGIRPEGLLVDDLAKILHVAIHYDVLNDTVQSLVDSLVEARDAMDPEWMFPNGHDDGESVD